MQGNYNITPLDFAAPRCAQSETGETRWTSTFDFLTIPSTTAGHGSATPSSVQSEIDQPRLTEVPRPRDQARPQRKFARFPAIDFHVHGKQGIRLTDALVDDFCGLADADSQAMEASAAKVTYLIEWLGYSPLRKQMNARRIGGLQSRSRIAKQIVEVVEEFIEERRNYNTTEAQWRVGPGYIELESLYLMELRRISKATWLVVLACATP